jgi:hypothetical protein
MYFDSYDITNDTFANCIHERKVQSQSSALHFYSGYDDSHAYLIVNEEIELFDITQILYNFLILNPRPTAEWFCWMFSRRKELPEAEYHDIIVNRHNSEFYGVFDIDFSANAVSIPYKDTWLTFMVNDLASARYFAMRRAHISDDHRRRIFFRKLRGKAVVNNG